MTNDKELYKEEIRQLMQDPKVQNLKNFPQHNGSNTLRHSLAVAKRSYELAEELGWDINEHELARGAMLHDYYLYEIKKKGYTAFHHGTKHPVTAMNQAKEDFDLNDKEMAIIRSHMWPLTLLHPPRSKEALLICMADKDIAMKEFARPGINLIKKHSPFH
jgi:uncharacterized protein